MTGSASACAPVLEGAMDSTVTAGEPIPPDARLARLLGIMARLRSDGGCPWDREQTLDTLKPFLVEESYELIDAIETGSVESHREELGDLLLQIVFQAQIRREQGEFAFADVIDTLADKLVRRHPHVFGSTEVAGSADVVRNWDAIKAKEKGDQPDRSALDGIPRHLPALQKAHQVQSRASRVGFDWIAVHDVMLKIEEELRELKQAMGAQSREAITEEIGDLLFSVVNIARYQGINSEEALSRTIAKFIRRFREIERRVRASGRTLAECGLDEMDSIWNEVKRDEAARAAAESRGE